ncbi:MAG: hypothetical protein M3Y05_15810 [Gemmatimonadota bacterium]|nr:hypothetical protein [Gemmatimonadota bacterium]
MKVLVAADSVLIRRLIEAAVVDRGHEPIAVADGAEAWKAFANVVKRQSQLEAPTTVEYLTDATMLDLSERSSRSLLPGGRAHVQFAQSSPFARARHRQKVPRHARISLIHKGFGS